VRQFDSSIEKEIWLDEEINVDGKHLGAWTWPLQPVVWLRATRPDARSKQRRGLRHEVL